MTVPARFTREQLYRHTREDLLAMFPGYFLEYPCMTGEDLRWYEETLLFLARCCSPRPLEVLEWGSGGSTVYMTKVLIEQGVNFTWRSLESNPEWYNKIRQRVDGQRVTLKLFDRGNIDLKLPENRQIDMEDYIRWPSRQKDRYDLVIVDGRRRRRCLLEARRLIRPNGTVILHDAWRVYYHCACNTFAKSLFIEGTSWWKGQHYATD